jgi:DNA-binding LacI/PurR family transcriptional regulator
VSRVINNSDKVKASTREKVLKVISDLDYEVNAVARSLRLRKTKNIGLITGNMLSTFWSIIARAIHDVAKKYGYNIILCCNDTETPEEEYSYLSVLKSSRVAGIIIAPTCHNMSYLQGLIDSGIEIVFIDRNIEQLMCESVLIDDEVGAHQATQFLIDQGYTRIALINGPRGVLTADERLKGYYRAHAERDMEVEKELVRSGSWKQEFGEKVMSELLDLAAPPDAVFATNVELALGAILTLKKFGVPIPDDIGVMAFSDYDWTKIVEPPLSVVDFSIASIGEKAMELLLKRVENSSSEKRNTVIRVKTNLVIRGSTRNMRESDFRKQDMSSRITLNDFPQ